MLTWNYSSDLELAMPVTNDIDIDVVSDVAMNAIPHVTSIDSVWNSMSQDFSLDHKAQSARVQAEIRKLLADKDDFYRILRSASPYIYYIYQQTQARGLPAELALIPMIESEFNPNDHSNKGATGLWQLMPGTAHELGVKVRSGYDGRRNVIASTKAALAYFNDLGNYFKGNWYLAIAAYNCGQGKIQSTMKRTSIRNFWNLTLPRETMYYVPKLLAVAAILKNPEKYGVRLPPIINQPYFSELKVTKSVNLENIAKTSGINLKTLQKLNPDLNKSVSTKPNANTLLVPIKEEHIVRAQLADQLVKSPITSKAGPYCIVKA